MLIKFSQNLILMYTVRCHETDTEQFFIRVSNNPVEGSNLWKYTTGMSGSMK